jgi:YfiH family protein
MKQVHGNTVVKVETGVRFATLRYEADALLMRPAGVPAAVAAADCLPIALVGPEESGVVHAGWRGLCSGVIETALTEFEGGKPTAWIGPSIGPCHYQVGAEVVEAFARSNPGAPDFWTTDGDRFRFDLRAAARWVLRKAGAEVDDYEPPCTFCDTRFYSYRRDGETGRHAVVVWR